MFSHQALSVAGLELVTRQLMNIPLTAFATTWKLHTQHNWGLYDNVLHKSSDELKFTNQGFLQLDAIPLT